MTVRVNRRFDDWADDRTTEVCGRVRLALTRVEGQT
jgi:hypothetical protein